MVYENIQIDTTNLTVVGASFFTMDHTTLRLIEKNAAGDLIFSYFLDTGISQIYSLEFDGYYFWSLERSSGPGFKIKKWEIGTSELVNLVDEFQYVSDGVNNYDTYTMAVENYKDTTSTTAIAGTNSFDVTDGSRISIGDEIVIGPSTHSSYEDSYSKTTVIGKSGNTVTVSPVLSASFNSSNNLSFSRSFYIFSDTAPGSQSGALYKFATDSGNILALDTGNEYNKVRAATFFKDNVLFLRAGEVIWLDPDSVSISKSQAIDNLETSRATYYDTFDLSGESETLYRLEQKHVSYNDTTELWEEEDWSPLYNFNTSGTSPVVYFVSIKAEPPILQKLVSGPPPEDTKSSIKVIVLDQFRTPVSGVTVNFSSSAGAVLPLQDNTDANGEAESVYTADTTVGKVTITADV
jgi:hypothetical protein